MQFTTTIIVELDDTRVNQYFHGDKDMAREDFLKAQTAWARDVLHYDNYGKVISAWTKTEST